MNNPYNSITTFSRAPVIPQIATYFIFIIQALTFFICIYINYKSLSSQVVMIVLYLLSLFVQIIVTLKCSWSDPSDPIMISYRNSTPHQRKSLQTKDCLYCDICLSYVKQTSRHCKVCQRYIIFLNERCVMDFDHHCMWINNCIGSNNYYLFMAMIVATWVNLLVYVVAMVVLWQQQLWDNYQIQMIIIWVFAIVVSVFWILLTNLVVLHIYLIYKGLTTYQFIMQQRQQQRKARQQKSNAQKQQQKKRQTSMVRVHKGFQQQRPISEQNPSKNLNQNIFKAQHQINIHQNTQVIFGQTQSKTQKSQHLSNRKHSNPQPMIQSNQNIADDKSSLSSKSANQSKLSKFFTKNKSFKFFIGDQIGSRPKSSRLHPQDPLMFNSVRVNKNMSINHGEGANPSQVLYKSQIHNQGRTKQLKTSPIQIKEKNQYMGESKLRTNSKLKNNTQGYKQPR